METLLKLSDNLFQEESIILAAHSLVMGNKPANLTADQVISKLEKNGGVDTSKFGLFDSSTPNYTTFYPGVSADDLNPAESEFIHPVFRMLSQTIVNADSFPIDFSKGNILKESMSLMVGLTINPDHEVALGNALGAVEEVFWQNSYTDPVSGSKVPGGVNGKFKIDGKANPRIARGIMMSPPSIHSNSVTVKFLWEKSHPTMTDGEFFDKWGDVLDDGSLVRKIATKILYYRETSLVSLGADPFAQITDSKGKIIDPRRGKIFYQNTQSNSADKASYAVYEADYKNVDTYGERLDYTQYVGLSHFHKTTKPINNNPPNPETMDFDFKKLNETLSLTGDNMISDEAGLLSYVQGLAQQVSNLNTNISNLNSKLPEDSVLAVLAKDGVKDYILSADFMQDKAKRDGYEAKLTEARTKAVSNLKLAKGDNVDVALINIINTSDLAAVEALNATYVQELDSSMPLTCESCHSTKVSRASAKKHEPGEEHPENLSAREVGENIRASKRAKATRDFAGTPAE